MTHLMSGPQQITQKIALNSHHMTKKIVISIKFCYEQNRIRFKF